MFLTLADALSRGSGTERPFNCPVHNDSRPSASLNTVKGVWYCYTCGAHGSLTGEDALIEPDYYEVKRWMEDRIRDHHVYPESWLSRWDAGPVHPYWLGRFDEAAARRFRLGYDPDREAVTYPLRSAAGEVLGVVRRALEGDGPKYRYPRGVDVGQLLFNYSPAQKSAVVLCEGALDAVALWMAGVDAFAIYGSRLSARQVSLVDRCDPMYVYTCFDDDLAGYRAHQQVVADMPHRAVRRITWPSAWGKDIAELSVAQRLRVLPAQLAHDSMSCIESQSCGSSQGSRRLMKSSSGSTSTHAGLRIKRSRR